MAESQWYARLDGEVRGPFSESEFLDAVHHGRVTLQTSVSRDGTTWIEAGSVPGLAIGSASSNEKHRPDLAAAVAIAQQILRQTRAVSRATGSQARRVIQHGVHIVHARQCERALRQAECDLGEKMYKDGDGDETVREAILALDVEIERKAAAKESTGSMTGDRRKLLTQLGSSPAGQLVVGPEQQKVESGRQELDDCLAAIKESRGGLWPQDVAESRRAVLGYAVLGAIAALCMVIGLFCWDSGPNVKDLEGAWVEVPMPWEWIKSSKAMTEGKYTTYVSQFKAMPHDCLIIKRSTKGNAATFISNTSTKLRFFDLKSGDGSNKFLLDFREDGQPGKQAACELREGRLVYFESKKQPMPEGGPFIRGGVYERSRE